MNYELISIILPTFNESGNIKKLITSLTAVLKKEKIKFEIVVVDDNSPDGTAEVVAGLKSKFPIKLIIRKRNYGLANSIRRGIRESRGSILVIMDTDFNHKPKDVPRLLNKLKKENANMVIGSRYIKGGGMVLAEASKLQFIFSKIFNMFVRLLLNFSIHESLSGFFAIKKSKIKKLNLKTIFQGYGDYFIALIYAASKNGYKICEIPIVYGERKWGTSKTKLLKHSLIYFKRALNLRIKNA